MSEGDKTALSRDAAHHGGGGEAQPRQPNSFTQSKVLSIISSRQTHQDETGNVETVAPPVTKSEGTMRQLSLPVAPSGLSANAPVFVPKARQEPRIQQPINAGYTNDGVANDPSANAQQYDYYPTEGDYAYGQEGSEFYMGNQFGELTLEDTFDNVDQRFYSSNYSQASIEERFDLALKILTTNPSNHEEYLKPICAEIEKTSAYDRVATNMVENLYNQCIAEDNFRYIGARVCQYLNSSLKMEPSFTKRFVKRCQADFDKREKLIHGSPEDKKKLQGLGMLLAEIFLNVETQGSDGSPQRLSFLPSILISIVETLLSQPEDANIKCGCQLLKLSGSLIEDIVKNIPDKCVQFEGLFDSLRKLSTSSQISDNAKFHVEKLVKLKDDGWDTSLPQAPSGIVNPYAQNPYYPGGASGGFLPGQDQEPVYYDSLSKDAEDSGAHLLTEEEEADFLAWQNSCNYDGFKQDTGMGFEMEEAYEEFLNEQTPSYNNSYQKSSSAAAVSSTKPSGGPPSHPNSSIPDTSYNYYHQQHHHHSAPAPNTSAHHNHYGVPARNNYYPTRDYQPQMPQQQQQQQPPAQHLQQQQQQHYQQYDQLPNQQQYYNTSQYNQYQHPQQQQQQQLPPQQLPHHHHQQQQHQQQHYHQQYQQQQQQQQQQPLPRYSSQNPPPANDQFHFRRDAS